MSKMWSGPQPRRPSPGSAPARPARKRKKTGTASLPSAVPRRVGWPHRGRFQGEGIGRVEAPGGCGAACGGPTLCRFTSLDVGDSPPQVLLGHQLADDHQQVKFAVQEAMREVRRERGRVWDATGGLRVHFHHHHGGHRGHPAPPRSSGALGVEGLLGGGSAGGRE